MGGAQRRERANNVFVSLASKDIFSLLLLAQKLTYALVVLLHLVDVLCGTEDAEEELIEEDHEEEAKEERDLGFCPQAFVVEKRPPRFRWDGVEHGIGVIEDLLSGVGVRVNRGREGAK